MQIRGLSRTVLGIYLIAVGVVPYLPLVSSGLMPLVSLMAIVAGVLLLFERKR